MAPQGHERLKLEIRGSKPLLGLAFTQGEKYRMFKFRDAQIKFNGLYEMLIRDGYSLPPLDQFRMEVRQITHKYLKKDMYQAGGRPIRYLLATNPGLYDVFKDSLGKLKVSGSEIKSPMLRMVVAGNDVGPCGSHHVLAEMSDGRKLVYERTSLGDLHQMLYIAEVRGNTIRQREIARLVTNKHEEDEFFFQIDEEGLEEAAEILKNTILKG